MAKTPSQRCALFTTVYRTMNPGVLLSGGCERSEQRSPAELAALQSLRIGPLRVRDRQATVMLVQAPSAVHVAGAAALTGIELTIDRGKWRINGFDEATHGVARVRPD